MSDYAQFIDELKACVDILDVCRRLGMELSPRGSFYIAWPCPTGHDSKSKTPFHVLHHEQGVYCHSCGFSGDILHLVGEAIFSNREEHAEARDWLCQEFKIEPFFQQHLNENELARYLERREEERVVRCILTESARFWHDHTAPQIFDILQQNWGIHQQSTKKLLIGYASGEGLYEHLLSEDFSSKDIKKTGLFSGKYEYFKRRLMFPYWYRGQVVYFIGRKVEDSIGAPKEFWTQTGDSEQDQYEEAKYKKLRVYNSYMKGRQHISEVIRNDHLYNGVPTKNANRLVITEGITDCIAATQAGITAVAIGAVRFRKEDLPQILKRARKFEEVYICMDNEVHAVGNEGAFVAAKQLTEEGIEARITTLPRDESEEKIDICEFLKKNSPESMIDLLERSPTVLEIMIQDLSKHKDRLRLAKAADALIPLIAVQSPLAKAVYMDMLCAAGLSGEVLLYLRERLENTSSDSRE